MRIGRAFADILLLILYVATWAAFLWPLWPWAGLLYASSCGVVLGSIWAASQWSRRMAVACALLLAWPLYVPYHILREGRIYPQRFTRARAGVLTLAGVMVAAAAAFALPGYSGPNRMRSLDVQLLADCTNQGERKARVLAWLEADPYAPPWWLRGRHGQTFFPPFFRSVEAVPFRRERLSTPDDDFLDVYFYDGKADAPTVVLLHGLEGSSQSKYILGFSHAFHALGWNVAALEFRTCGPDLNRAPRAYHMGETTDLDFLVRTLIAQNANCRLYLAGVSLGGNVLGKWLGEQGESIPPQVKGAALLSPPFRPDVAAPAFHKVLGGFYVWHFMRTLRPKGLAKAAQYPDRLDAEAIRRSRDFYDYDTVVTAKLHGFRDAEDYWQKVACAQFLPAVRVPTLLLTSADDPFNPATTIPREIADASPWLHPLWTERGGHVGFVSGPAPWSLRYWSEDQIVAFFRLYEGATAP